MCILYYHFFNKWGYTHTDAYILCFYMAFFFNGKINQNYFLKFLTDRTKIIIIIVTRRKESCLFLEKEKKIERGKEQDKRTEIEEG